MSFDDRTLRLPTTKTGRPLTIPMSRQVEVILRRRMAERVNDCPYVFLAERRREGAPPHMASLREKTLSHRGHDMRAAMISYALAAGVPKEVVRLLVGHRSGDVTDGYVNVQAMTEYLRDAAQRVADYLDEVMGVRR